MPRLMSFVDPSGDAGQEAPIRVCRTSGHSFEFLEADHRICVLQSHLLPVVTVQVSNETVSWEFHNVHRHTSTKGILSPSGQSIDVEFAIRPGEFQHPFILDRDCYLIKELGTGTSIIDANGKMALKVASSWRDSDRRNSIVAHIWPYQLPDPPVDIAFLAFSLTLHAMLCPNDVYGLLGIW